MTKEFILRICKPLIQNEVNFVVTGGSSSFIRGSKVGTLDLDLLVNPTNSNISKLKLGLEQIKSDNLSILDQLSLQQIVRINAFPFTIDILPKLDGLEMEQVMNNKEDIQYSGMTIPVICETDLKLNYQAINKA